MSPLSLVKVRVSFYRYSKSWKVRFGLYVTNFENEYPLAMLEVSPKVTCHRFMSFISPVTLAHLVMEQVRRRIIISCPLGEWCDGIFYILQMESKKTWPICVLIYFYRNVWFSWISILGENKLHLRFPLMIFKCNFYINIRCKYCTLVHLFLCNLFIDFFKSFKAIFFVTPFTI